MSVQNLDKRKYFRIDGSRNITFELLAKIFLYEIMKRPLKLE